MVGVPEIFGSGISCVIRRAVIIGNGAAGAEHQCLGLVRALGLGDYYTLERVYRPREGFNYWLRWLPLNLHRGLDTVVQLLLRAADLRFLRRKYGLAEASSDMAASGGRGGGGDPYAWGFRGKMTTSALSYSRSVVEEGIVMEEADAMRIADMANNNFERDGPLLVIASGHDTIGTAAAVKRLAPDSTFVVQIQHPRCDVRRFDLVITPKHDYHVFTPEAKEEIVPNLLLRFLTPSQGPEDERVVLTTGSLHHADMATLRSAAGATHGDFGQLPKPLIYVSIGCPTKHCTYGVDVAQEIVAALDQTLEVSGGCAWISFSRRTPIKLKEHIWGSKLAEHPRVVSIWDGDGRRGGATNPHLGLLSWADAFVFTAESISLLSEACSTGKPVYVAGRERCKWKLAEFHRSLESRGATRKFTGSENMRDSWSYPPLNDNAEAARKVREILAGKGWHIRQS